MKTLEEILAYEKAHRNEDGPFGIAACKASIESTLKFVFNGAPRDEALKTLLVHYVAQSNYNIFFNNAMVLACYELLQERNVQPEQATSGVEECD